MNVRNQIKSYIAAQPEPKRSDLQELYGIILGMMPDCKLWFLDGKDESGRMVSNPNIGYGLQTMKYADGKTREFYQIGISTNTTGISVYISGNKGQTSPGREVWEKDRPGKRDRVLHQVPDAGKD